MSELLRSIFRRPTADAARAKFLTKNSGIFSEEIVRLWASGSRARYESGGRPAIKSPGDERGHTLDFTLRERTTGKVFVVDEPRSSF